MAIVVDASTVVAALVDSGPDGRWAEDQLRSGPVVAPNLLLAEVSNVLRRAELTGEISPESAALAFDALQSLPFDAVTFEAYAERIWELRHTVTAYDAFYVALAEAIDAPLATLDIRLSNAPGPTCRFELP